MGSRSSATAVETPAARCRCPARAVDLWDTRATLFQFHNRLLLFLVAVCRDGLIGTKGPARSTAASFAVLRGTRRSMMVERLREDQGVFRYIRHRAPASRPQIAGGPSGTSLPRKGADKSGATIKARIGLQGQAA